MHWISPTASPLSSLSPPYGSSSGSVAFLDFLDVFCGSSEVVVVFGGMYSVEVIVPVFFRSGVGVHKKSFCKYHYYYGYHKYSQQYRYYSLYSRSEPSGAFLLLRSVLTLRSAILFRTIVVLYCFCCQALFIFFLSVH